MIVAVLAAMTGANAHQEDKNMGKKVARSRFEPQEWMELELDWSEYVWSMRERTPVLQLWMNGKAW